MANYCSNSVRFLGSAAAIDQIRDIFENIEHQQQRTNRYHLPDFVNGGTGYMEDVAIGPDWISYETHSVPNLEVLDQIAGYYGLNYIAWYAEPMAGLYGEAVCSAGETRFVNIDTYTQKGRGNNPAFLELKQLQASLLTDNQPER